jgi:hypothetical protein
MPGNACYGGGKALSAYTAISGMIPMSSETAKALSVDENGVRYGADGKSRLGFYPEITVTIFTELDAAAL